MPYTSLNTRGRCIYIINVFYIKGRFDRAYFLKDAIFQSKCLKYRFKIINNCLFDFKSLLNKLFFCLIYYNMIYKYFLKI